MFYNKLKIVAWLLLFSLILFIGGCANSTSPLNNIRQKYGNQKFKISFDCTDSEIIDIEYSAYYIPELKTPKKLGYIFKGWFFDKNFEEPFAKDALYLKMHDLTLYPKWEKEELNQPGIYAVNYKSRLLENTILLGPDTDKVSPWKNVCDYFIKDQIGLEKNYQDKLFLKIAYTQDCIIPFPNDGDCFLITPHTKMGNKVKYHSEIAPLSEKVRTIYFDITNFNLENEIIFSVRFLNYFEPGITKSKLIASQVNYDIAFKIENVIGLERPFINATKGLNNGSYQIKGFFYKGDSASQLSMLSGWNPTFMHLDVIDNDYFLTLQMKTYDGIVPNYQTNTYLENSKHRMMTYYYAPFYYTYNPNENKFINNQSTHLGSTIKGDKMQTTKIYYNTQNKTITHKFYLGKSIDKDIMLEGILSGFMETTSAMGMTEVSLRLDRNSIIKIGSTIQNLPKHTKAMEFSEKIAFYPGAIVDLKNGNLLYNYIKDNNKINNRIANFFYEKNSSTNEEKLLDHEVNIELQATKPLKDAKFFIFEAIITYKVFDYNNDNELLIDYSLFHIPEGLANRRSKQLVLGKSFNNGDLVNLENLFKTMVNPSVNFQTVAVSVYDNNGLINLTNNFNFDKNLKVVYQYNINNIQYQTVLLLEKYIAPVVEVFTEEGLTFDPTKEFFLGSKMSIPKINYWWMGDSGEYYGTNKYNYDGQNHFQVDYMNIAIFKKNNNIYLGSYIPIHFNEIIIDEKNIILFQIFNKFNETKKYEYLVSAKKPTRYKIFDPDEKLLDQNTIRYHDGKIIKVNVSDSRLYPASTVNNFYENYYWYEDENKHTITLSSYNIYFKTKDTISYELMPGDSFASIISALTSYQTDPDLVYIKLTYKQSYVTVTACLLFKYKVNNQENINLYYYENFYTNTLYKRLHSCLTINGRICSSKNISFLYSADDKDAGFYEIVKYNDVEYYRILKPGKYKLVYKLNFVIDPDGNFITSNHEMHLFTFTHFLNVLDYEEETVTINFHSDLHQFTDNTNLVTKQYKIKDLINVLGYTDFINVGDDHFAGWSTNPLYTTKQAQYLVRGGVALDDFTHKYATSTIDFYAIWDQPITIVLQIDNTICTDNFSNQLLYAPHGSYMIDLRDFEPKKYNKLKYRFLGWKGEITNDEIIRNKQIPFLKPTNFTIVAVFEVI